jgi:hypothetical protein
VWVRWTGFEPCGGFCDDPSHSEVAFFDAATLKPTGAALRMPLRLHTPRLSPDGRYLLAYWQNTQVDESNEGSRLTVFDVRTGAVVKRGSKLNGVTVVGNVPAAWLPDGRYLYMVGKNLYVSSPAVAEETLLSTFTGLPGGAGPVTVVGMHLAVSPDGRRVVFSWGEGRGTALDSNIWVANVDGTDLRRLVRGVGDSALTYPFGSPTWSPDSKWVAVILYMAGVVWGPYYPDYGQDPPPPATVIGTTGCTSQVLVFNADSPPASQTFPRIDGAHGIAVLDNDNKPYWLTVCTSSATVSWVP